MPYTFTNENGDRITVTIERSDTPPGQELSVNTDADQADVIDAVSHLMYAEDGYEEERENRAAEVFILLCQVARRYAQLSATTPDEPDHHDMWGTLQGLAENMSDEQHAFGVTEQSVQPD